MSNNLPATLQNAVGAMAAVTKTIDASSGDFDYLKLTKAGEWVHGAEDTEVDAKSIFVVDTNSFFVGFQAWDDGELMGEEMRAITEPPLTKADLRDVGCEWKPLIGFQLVCISGADKGLQLVYKTTSKGGIKAINGLMKTIVARLSEDHGGELTAIIKLENDSYRHKKYGKIYTPVLNVMDWTSDEPMLSDEDEDDYEDDYEDDAPEEAEPEPEPEPEPTPRRRRRRA